MKLHIALLLTTLIAFVKFHNSVARSSKNGLDHYLDYMLKHQNEDDNVIIGNNIKDRYQVNGKTTIHYGDQDYVKYWNKHESPDNGNRNHYGSTGYVSQPDFVYEPIKTPNNGVTVTRASGYQGVGDNRNTNTYNRHNNENRYHTSSDDFVYEPIKTPNNGVTVTRASGYHHAVPNIRHNNENRYHASSDDIVYEPIKTPNNGVTVTQVNGYRGVGDNRNTNFHHAGSGYHHAVPHNWHNNESPYLDFEYEPIKTPKF
ncbi:GATA zinc finger domain-containing protein 14-like isoform X1 [Calliphora vicina]|uniref:GATA zinc finger domain-containing protein 14-like isoform X1 n=1 Tax=Calliphora vicina TaxID=7373 RepID=UPI00325A9D4E